MSAEEPDQMRYLNDDSMFDNLEGARAMLRRRDLPIRKRISNVGVSYIMPLQAKNVPEQFKPEFEWILDNITSRDEQLDALDDGFVGQFAYRTAKFADELLRWREENS